MVRADRLRHRFDDCKPQGRTTDFHFIASLLDRKAREETGLFWAEGCRSLHAGVESQAPIRSIVVCRALLHSRDTWNAIQEARHHNIPIVEVCADKFARLSTHSEMQGVGVVVHQRWEPLIELSPAEEDVWIAFDAIRSNGNLGTALRTCTAVGAKGVMLIGGEADPFDPQCVRASMGAIFHQRFIRTSAKSLLGWRARHPCHILGASPDGAVDYRNANYKGPLLLMMGSERKGLREKQKQLCDQMVRLPQSPAIDSLNLAVATSILLYKAFESRGF